METRLVRSCFAKHAFNCRIKWTRRDIHRGIRSSAKIAAADVIGYGYPPFKLTPLRWAHILSFGLVSTGDFSKGVPMPDVAIPYHVDAALERGLEGRGIAREDALSLMEEAPLADLAPDGCCCPGPLQRQFGQLFQKSLHSAHPPLPRLLRLLHVPG